MMSELVMTHCPNCPKGRASPNSLDGEKSMLVPTSRGNRG